jgi:hypothetical protein
MLWHMYNITYNLMLGDFQGVRASDDPELCLVNLLTMVSLLGGINKRVPVEDTFPCHSKESYTLMSQQKHLPLISLCHTRISGHQDPGANIITRCAGTKSHTYDES